MRSDDWAEFGRSVSAVERLTSIAILALIWVLLPTDATQPNRIDALQTGRLPTTDEPGLYVLLGPIVRLGAEADLTIHISQVLLALVAIALAPTMLELAAIALAATLTLPAGDVYFMSAWPILVATPVLLRPLGSRRVLAVAVLAIGIEWFRAGAGLPVIAGFAIALLASRRWQVLAIVAATYALLRPTGHLIWHTSYIGLGYLPNPYGITYIDESAIATAERLSPGVIFATPQYESVLRSEFLRIAQADPLFIVRTVVAKIVALPIVLASLEGAILIVLRRWRLAAMFLAMVATAMLPSLIAVPLPRYETGIVAVVTFWLAPLIAVAMERLRSPGAHRQLYGS